MNRQKLPVGQPMPIGTRPPYSLGIDAVYPDLLG